MKRFLFGTMIFVLVFTVFGAGVFAQYRSRSASAEAGVGSDDFARAVDLERFRKGNEYWDVQELVASGLTALHRDHVRILEQLEGLKAKIKQLEKRK